MTITVAHEEVIERFGPADVGSEIPGRGFVFLLRGDARPFFLRVEAPLSADGLTQPGDVVNFVFDKSKAHRFAGEFVNVTLKQRRP